MTTIRPVFRSIIIRPAAALAAVTALAAAAPAQSPHWRDLGLGTPGCCGVPRLQATTPRYGEPLLLRVSSAAAGAPVWLVVGFGRIDLPILGGLLVPQPDLAPFPAGADGGGNAGVRLRIPELCGAPPVRLYVQALVADPAAPAGFAFSNALTGVLHRHVESDFDGDGYADVAIGVPGEEVLGMAGAGAVNVTYGTAAGLTNGRSQLIRQGFDLGGVILGTPEADDGFGAALAVGDFDGDGFADLAIGVPREDAVGPARRDSGVVQVVYGSPQGLQGGNAGRDDQLIRQGVGGVQGSADDYDWFGKALVAGDFDGDGFADLAIGVPYEDAAFVNQGVVQVLFGSATGLSGAGDLYIEEPHQPASDDRFGWTLTAGDFDGDGDDDLGVGRPYENVQGEQDAGAVSILYMHGGAVAAAANLHRNASLSGVAIQGTARTYDLFGFTVAAGDYNGDGVADLAVGVPYADLINNTVSAAGAVHVIYGRLGIGLVGQGNQVWTQETPGILDTAQLSDRFGYALAAADFDGDGDDDLAVGVPGEEIAGTRTGAVQVLNGSAAGIVAAGNVLWHPSSLGFAPGAADDLFGWSLFAGDFDRDCGADLVMGIPGAAVNGRAAAGAVAVRYAGPVANQIWSQGPLSGSPGAGDRFGAALANSPDQRPL